MVVSVSKKQIDLNYDSNAYHCAIITKATLHILRFKSTASSYIIKKVKTVTKVILNESVKVRSSAIVKVPHNLNKRFF